MILQYLLNEHNIMYLAHGNDEYMMEYYELLIHDPL